MNFLSGDQTGPLALEVGPKTNRLDCPDIRSTSQRSDSTQASPPPPPKPRESTIYWGGSITLSFGNSTHVGISPLVGFKLTPKMSIGIELTCEYLKYDGAREGSNNYGASAFTRYRIRTSASRLLQVVHHRLFEMFRIRAKNGCGSSFDQSASIFRRAR